MKKIRTYRVLKQLATILFLLEFLAPALAIEAHHSDLLHDQLHENYNHNLWFALLNEELTENEENREHDKSQVIILDFVTVLLSLNNTHTTSADSYPALAQHQYACQPPLFKLNCIYLI